MIRINKLNRTCPIPKMNEWQMDGWNEWMDSWMVGLFFYEWIPHHHHHHECRFHHVFREKKNFILISKFFIYYVPRNLKPFKLCFDTDSPWSMPSSWSCFLFILKLSGVTEKLGKIPCKNIIVLIIVDNINKKNKKEVEQIC